jgi:hypothetical protein
MACKRIPYAGSRELWSPGPAASEDEDAPAARPRNDNFGAAAYAYAPAELGEAYAVGDFARKHHLDRAKAIDILMRAGPSRERADEMAIRLQASGGR